MPRKYQQLLKVQRKIQGELKEYGKGRSIQQSPLAVTLKDKGEQISHWKASMEGRGEAGAITGPNISPRYIVDGSQKQKNDKEINQNNGINQDNGPLKANYQDPKNRAKMQASR